MKKIITIFVLFQFFINLNAQSGFSYQGVLRNSDGKLRTNETLNLYISLIKDKKEVVYSEKQQVVSNAYGVFSMVIGSGEHKTDYSPSIFLNKDSTRVNDIYLEVKEGLTTISYTQILGVPFAEVAKVALKAHIDFPAGSIIAFGGDTSHIPEGWFLCDGKGYSKTIYRALFDAIGVNWGKDGELFRVPDLRGVFLRGVNLDATDMYSDPEDSLRTSRYTKNGNNGNTGNNVGSFQADALAKHNHEIKHMQSIRKDGTNGYAWGSHDSYSSNYTADFGGEETRPVNAYVYYIIKY